MKNLFSPQSEADLFLIHSVLGGEEIPYFVHNDHFGFLRIGHTKGRLSFLPRDFLASLCSFIGTLE